MSNEVKISSIVLQFGDREITIPIDQAKKIRDALNEIFGAPETSIKIVEREVIRDRSWDKPYITWEDKPNFPDLNHPNIIYCANQNALTIS